MNIRLATSNDIEAINALYAYLNPGDPRVTTPQSIQAAIDATHVYFIVMEDFDIETPDTSHIVGTGCLNEIVQPSQIQRKGFLDDFVLHPVVRGKGYGEKLYFALEQEARRRGYRLLNYTVGQGEKRAAMRRLHSKMGHLIRAHATLGDETNYYEHNLTK